jgi:hypothetical protein
MSDPAPNPRARIGFERRRQMQVRAALMAGLKSNATAIFLHACAEYLVDSLTRLDAQDMGISDRLKARVPRSEIEVHAGLAALDERQARARAATADFSRAVAAYRGGGAAETFHASVRGFANLIQSMMAPRRNPYERFTDALFTADDWAAIADATPHAVAEEARLFARVKELAPPGADPDAMPALHGGPPPAR